MSTGYIELINEPMRLGNLAMAAVLSLAACGEPPFLYNPGQTQPFSGNFWEKTATAEFAGKGAPHRRRIK
jgi:hypothetical protein